MGPRNHFYSYMYLVNVDWDMCSMGRAPRTMETLPDFHEWYRVTRHPLLFPQVDRSSTDPRDWGVTAWYLGVRTVHTTQFCDSALFRVTVWTLLMETVHEHCSQGKKKRVQNF